jgi:hypothetical protein
MAGSDAGNGIFFAASSDAAESARSFQGSARFNKGADVAMVKAAGSRPFFN